MGKKNKKNKKRQGIGFRMSLCFTGWPWVCQGGEGAQREKGSAMQTQIHQNKDIKTVGQSTGLTGKQASACLHPVCVVFHMLITVCYHRRWEVCPYGSECERACVFLFTSL